MTLTIPEELKSGRVYLVGPYGVAGYIENLAGRLRCLSF
jgi:hypothetical protein